MPAAWMIGSAVVSGAFGLWGQSKEQSSNEEAARRANKQAIQDWKYDEKIRKKTNAFNQKQFQNDKENERNLRRFQNETAIQDWQYKKDIRRYENQLAQREWEQSEKNYQLQLKFNNIAAAQAYEAEDRKLREIQIGQALQQQDMLVQNIQEEGAARARGVAGRSAGKTEQSLMASYGRNVEILAESMKSAERQYKTNLDKINVEKLGADTNAEASRLLKPERTPSIPKPLPLPVARIIKPITLPKRKKPVGVSAGSSAGAYLSILGSTVSSAVSGAVQANN